LDDAELYFSDISIQLAERSALIKKIMSNPTKLHKIKKNQLVNAIQHELENDILYVDDQPYLTDQMGMYDSEPAYKRQESFPSGSTVPQT
jgi:hypothetical protein